MSDINLDFTVQTSNIQVVVDTNEITFTPSDIQLTLAQAILLPGGANGTLQYNNAGVMGGVANTNYDGSNLTLGDVSNVRINGGVNGYFLQTDGNGLLNWAAAGGGGNGSPGGSNTQIQYNDNGTFGGNAGFTFNEVTGQMSVIDIVAGNAGISGTISAGTMSTGNIQVTANVLAQNINSNANVIGTNFTANGNIGVSGNISVTGNVSANNATVSNLTLNSNVVHLGANAGSNSGPFTIAVGAGAGDNNQGFGAIAIGVGAAVAGNGQYSIAIGADAGLGVQGNSAIAIGTAAGLRGQSDYVIAIGANAGYDGPSNAQANNTIVLNATGANLVGNAFANAFYVKPVRNANTANVMFYNPTTGEISYDTFVANTANYANFANVSNIANSVAVANVSGIGNIATINLNGNVNTFLNGNGGWTQPTVSTANFANFAGNVVTASQPNITSLGTLTALNLNSNFVKLGSNTVASSFYGVALAGNANANAYGIAIGYRTFAGQEAVAIGPDATSAGTTPSIAIGKEANAIGQESIAIGYQAGGNSLNGIAIGEKARLSNTYPRTLVLNATGSNLTPTQSDALFVKPIRTVNSTAGLNQLYYDSTTGEIVVYVP
jgi:hypothetical protein